MRQLYFYPSYNKSAAEYNYITQGGSIQPLHGNTLAVSLHDAYHRTGEFNDWTDTAVDVHEYYRVQFTLEYENAEPSYPEAVWCDDLYRDQIQVESEDDDDLNFSYTFGKGDNSTKRWICPNITSELAFVSSANRSRFIRNDEDLLKAKALTAKAM